MKVLFFDTESTSLEASWGRILCASFATFGEPPYTYRGDSRRHRGKEKVDDSKLCLAIRDELEKADVIVSWNGILHDIPLLNARLSLVDERPCQLEEKFGTRHIDAMYYVRGSSMKIGGSKLDTAAKFFQLADQKTPLDGLVWQRAATGDKKALGQIVEHCESDVLVLRGTWPYVAPNIKKFTFTLSEVWPFIEQIPSRR